VSTSTTSTTVDGAAGEVEAVDVEGRPSAVVLVGSTLWVASDGEGEAAAGAAPAPGALRGYDAATGQATGDSIPVGPDPVALVGLEDAVWTVGATGVMTKVGLAAGAPAMAAQVDLGGALTDAVVAGERLWVADIGASVVHVLDPETGEVVDDPVVVEAGAVRLTVAGERIWVSGTDDQVTPIDTADLVAREPITVGNGPIGLAAELDVLWVANSDDDRVSRISLESGQSTGDPIAVGDAPIAVAIDGPDAWVLNQDDRSLHRLDAETGEPVGAPIVLPMRPRAMTVGPAGVWVVGVDPSQAVLYPSRSGPAP
jgi:DNA-binding beta-propeller fold protein YncE